LRHGTTLPTYATTISHRIGAAQARTSGMLTTEARVATASASRYLQQLCKHWSHKFAVEFTPDRGRIPFADDRTALLEATADTLTMRIEATDAETLARMEGVVVEHLKRFSFREDLGDIHWTRAQ
jgi:hypothetical protein